MLIGSMAILKLFHMNEEPVNGLEIVANETSDNLCITFRRAKDKKKAKEIGSVNYILKLIDLEQFIEVLEAEQRDLDTLFSLKPEQFMEMVGDVGITPWGHRHKLREALDNLKETTTNDDDPIEKSYQSETCNVESSDSLELFPTSFSDDVYDLCAHCSSQTAQMHQMWNSCM